MDNLREWRRLLEIVMFLCIMFYVFKHRGPI